MVSLTNSKDIVANTISVIDKDKVIDLKELFLSKLDAINNIVGLPVETLNSLQKLAEAINSDSNFFNNIMAAIDLKSDLTYVNTQLDTILRKFLNYDTIDALTIKLDNKSSISYVDSSCKTVNDKFLFFETVVGNNIKLDDKADKTDTYPKAEINTAILTINASLDNKCSTYAVDIQSKFKIKATSDDILKIQKIDGSILHDTLEISFNPVDKTSILKFNNVDILDSISNKAVSNNVYNKTEVDLKFSSLIGASPDVLNTIVELATALNNDSNYAAAIQTQLSNKADKTDTYPKAEINTAILTINASLDNKCSTYAVDIQSKFKIKAISDDVLKIQKISGSNVHDCLELEFNPVDNTSKLKLNNVDIMQSISTNTVSEEALSLKADKSDTYPKAEINTAILTINASLDNKCSTYAVDIQSKFKIKATSDNTLKIQKISGSNVYDCLALVFDPIDNTSVLKLNNVDILQSISTAPTNTTFTERITMRAPNQYGGAIRVITAIDEGQASIGFYNWNDARWTTVGDAWVTGINCWDKQGYSIGTPVLNNCFNIGLDGNVSIDYGFTCNDVATDTLRASTLEYLTIEDSVELNGYLNIAGETTISNTLNIQTTTGWGNIKIIPSVDTYESSIGFYNRTDKRITTAGDVWMVGANSNGILDFAIGTPERGACLSIDTLGTVNIPHKLTTPTMDVRIIKSTNPELGIKIDEALIVTGEFYTMGYGSIGGRLNVAEGATFNGTLIIRAPTQVQANIRILTSANNNEGSIAYYNRVDEQETVAGDIWTTGINTYSNNGYSIGTNVSNSCFNIQPNGVCTANYRLVTPTLYATTIMASNATVVTLDDDVEITKNLKISKPWSATSGNINLTDSTGNYIFWNNSGLGGPTFNTRSVGTKLVLYPSIATANCDYALGIDNGILWFSTPSTTQTHRFYTGITVALDISSTSLISPGKIYNYQPAHTASTTAGATALTLAHLVNGIYQTTQTVAITLPLPTGTAMYAAGCGNNQSMDWTVINSGTVAAGTTTVQVNTNHTLIGSGLVAFQTSCRFRTRISGLNTAVTYRIS